MSDQRYLGDYTIIKQVGQGPLGSVFLAEHRYMKSPYVLKVLPEELASDRPFVQRFEEDVASLVSLNHPNIVKIHNISFAQGQYFLVTDCIVDELGETTNLAQFMLSNGSRLDEEERFRLLRQIADALDFAHGKRNGGKPIVHRGIKLNNILIGKGKQGVELFLSDYGLSRIIGPGAILTRTYKMIAEAMGISHAIAAAKTGSERYPTPSVEAQKLTPLHLSFLQNYAFMAPEQKRIDSGKPVDIKADIYAFGVLTYYMLTGEIPEGCYERVSEKYEGLKMDWDRLIAGCMQVDPDKRPGQLIPVLDSIRQGKIQQPVLSCRSCS